MKKTPLEEARIATRRTADGSVPARPEDTCAILEMIDTALAEQAAWLREWHRAAVCGTPPAQADSADRFRLWLDLNERRGLLDQPVFRQLRALHRDMHECGRTLAQRAARGERLPAGDYDRFTDKAEGFSSLARRVRDAFQRALYDLDPLTGVHNRRSMAAELDRERERSSRTGKPAYVGLCDIDDFKGVNDAHGHVAGDSVLLAIAGRLIANLRPYDSVYRYGGDEFLLAFTETDSEQAVKIANRLRAAVAGSPVPVDGSSLAVTVSFGLCRLDPEAALETTITRADEALHRAKSEGRNRVGVWRAPAGGEGPHG